MQIFTIVTLINLLFSIIIICYVADIEKNCNEHAKINDIKLSMFQSNIEGELVEKIQASRNNQDGLIIKDTIQIINRNTGTFSLNHKLLYKIITIKEVLKKYETSYSPKFISAIMSNSAFKIKLIIIIIS